MGQKQTHALQQIISLFDHLVGALLELKRNVKSERLGGFEINYELVFCRLLEW